MWSGRRVGALVMGIAIALGLTVVLALALGAGARAKSSDAVHISGLGSGSESVPGVAQSTPGTGGPVKGGFSIAGSVDDLYPGSTGVLALTVTNPLQTAIVVRSITTAVTSTSTTCAAGNVTVEPFAGHQRIPADHAGEVMVSVTMDHAAPDACQGAAFPFEYSGWATR